MYARGYQIALSLHQKLSLNCLQVETIEQCKTGLADFCVTGTVRGKQGPGFQSGRFYSGDDGEPQRYPTTREIHGPPINTQRSSKVHCKRLNIQYTSIRARERLSSFFDLVTKVPITSFSCLYTDGGRAACLELYNNGRLNLHEGNKSLL